MDDTLGTRIRLARKAKALSQTELANLVGARGNATVSEWERDESVPGGDNLIALVRELGIDGHWLLTGDGHMERSDPTADDQAIREIEAVLRRRSGSMRPLKTRSKRQDRR